MTSAEQNKTHVSFIDAPKKYGSLYNRGNKNEYFTVAHNANRSC